MYKRVDTLLNASNISVNAGTDRVFVEENMRFYLPVFSNTLSIDTSKVVPALESNWWWVWAPLAEQRKGWETMLSVKQMTWMSCGTLRRIKPSSSTPLKIPQSR